MSFYSMVFGRNIHADAILATLGLRRQDTGRFRDCFVAKGKIAVYTRNGGGNREDYEDVFKALSNHPCYLNDEDDEFDCTYATIYFSFPEEYKEELAALDSGKEFNPSQRWLETIEAMKRLSAEVST